MENSESQVRADVTPNQVYSSNESDEVNRKQTEGTNKQESDSTAPGPSFESVTDNSQITQECSRQRHSQIEKRRRKKMNTYIMELSALLPKYTAAPKLDKITILKKAVEHVKSIQGSTNVYCKLNKPPFLSDDEMKCLIHQVTKRMDDESFLFAISCVQGQFMYVSETASYFLGINQSDLLRLSIFDVLHYKDVSQVKEQLSYKSHGPLYESKQKMPHMEYGISSGSWRSFFCRFKSPLSSLNEQNFYVERRRTDSSNCGFLTVHCSGFIKPFEMTDDFGDNIKIPDSKQNHLIVLARVIRSPVKIGSEIETSHSYHTKLETDGKIMQVDQKICGLLGYLPQELLGMSVYELYHQEDLSKMAKAHQCVLQTSRHIVTPEHRLRTKSGDYITLQNDMWRFINPWNKATDFILCLSKVITLKDNDGDCPQDRSRGSLIGVGNIGRLIAKEALEKETSVSDQLIPPLLTGSESDILNNADLYGLNDSSEYSPTNSYTSLSSMGQSAASLSSNSPSPSNNMQHNVWPKFQQAQNQPPVRHGNDIHERKSLPPLRNGLRNQHNENLWTGGNNHQALESDESSNQNPHGSQSSSCSNYGCRSSDDNAMSVVMSLLEDDPASFDQIDLGDFAWAL